jgi:predicted ester cyclase
MIEPVPAVLREYVAGLAAHDADKVANTLSDNLLFFTATRVLDKTEFLAMLNALYTAFPDWHYEHEGIENRGQGNYAIKWHQRGTHNGTWNLPGMESIAPTAKRVKIPPHYFFYRIADNKLTIIFPEPVVGGAPRGILEQIGVTVPDL